MANVTLSCMPWSKSLIWVSALFHSGLTPSWYEIPTSHNPISSLWAKSSLRFFSLYILFYMSHLQMLKLGYECILTLTLRTVKWIMFNFVGTSSSPEGLGRFKDLSEGNFLLRILNLFALLSVSWLLMSLFFYLQERGPLAASLAYVSRTI